jgi:TIR domain
MATLGAVRDWHLSASMWSVVVAGVVMVSGRFQRFLALLGLASERGALDRPIPSEGLSIFISYRRGDGDPKAFRIRDALAAQLGDQRVAMDVESIGAGLDWVDLMRGVFDSFGIVLAVIGPDWNPLGSDNRRRLEDPKDFVRSELEMALSGNVSVVPVLVDGATMPAASDLPAALAPLSRRNAVELVTETWDDDIAKLIAAVRRYDEAAAGVPWGAVEPLQSGPN